VCLRTAPDVCVLVEATKLSPSGSLKPDNDIRRFPTDHFVVALNVAVNGDTFRRWQAVARDADVFHRDDAGDDVHEFTYGNAASAAARASWVRLRSHDGPVYSRNDAAKLCRRSSARPHIERRRRNPLAVKLAGLTLRGDRLIAW
jgi:hypothetical protein